MVVNSQGARGRGIWGDGTRSIFEDEDDDDFESEVAHGLLAIGHARSAPGRCR
jgi:hypothetical protein